MIDSSPFLLVRQLQGDVLRLLSGIDTADLDTAQQQDLTEIRNEITDVRLDIQDYELAETREHQMRNMTDAKKRLKKLDKFIVNNTLNVFGAVDTAHLTAQIAQINDRLR